jgi:hypothetical protein
MMAGLHPILCHAMHRSLTPSLSLIVLAATLFAASAVSAQTTAQTPAKPAQGSFGQGKGSGPLLTRAELRQCLSQQDSLRTSDEELRRERQALDNEKSELVRLGTELKEQLAALDRSSQEAVDQYNGRAAARDQRIDALEARMAPFNARVEAVAAERAAFGKRCDNRRYDERDEIAIKNGK